MLNPFKSKTNMSIMLMEQITHVTKCNKNNDTDNKIILTIKEALRGGLRCPLIESVNRVKIEIYFKKMT